MDYYNEVDYSMPEKLDAYYDDPEVEVFGNMPELEEMDGLDNESHEDSPRPAKKALRRSARSKKRKRRSSSVESEQEEEQGEKLALLSNTNKEINVGEDYQVAAPEDTRDYYSEDHEDPDELIWSCPEEIVNEELDEFVKEANLRYRIPIDRALYILWKEGYNYKNAINFISKRTDLRDIWSDEEVTHFYNTFYVFGKNFRRIQTMMPHRSITSIVQYYYDSKKRINYRNFSENKPPETTASLETGIVEVVPVVEKNIMTEPDTVFEHMCENCGERCEQMEMVEKLNSRNSRKQAECRACRVYYEMMDAPRPTSLRIVLSERLKSHYNIPDFMKNFMKDFDELAEPSSGRTYSQRKMGNEQKVEDILGLSYNAKAKIAKEEDTEGVKMEVEEDVEPGAKFSEKFLADPEKPSGEEQLPKIWKQKHTNCQEEIEVLQDDARHNLFEASVLLNGVNKKEMNAMKAEMNAIRSRMERMYRDIDLAPSYLNKKRKEAEQPSTSTSEPPEETEWSSREVSNAMKLFEWYGPETKQISAILGTRSAQEVDVFYRGNRATIDPISQKYADEIQAKIDELDKEIDDSVD